MFSYVFRRPRCGRRSRRTAPSGTSRLESEERNQLDSKEGHQRTGEGARKIREPQQEVQNTEDEKTIEAEDVDIESDESTLEPVTLLEESQLLPERDDKHADVSMECQERKTSAASHLSADHALSEQSGELTGQSRSSTANSSSGYQSAGQQSLSSRESTANSSDALDNTLAMIDSSSSLRLSNDFSLEQSSSPKLLPGQDHEETKSCGGSPKRTVSHVVARQHDEEVSCYDRGGE